MRACTLSLRYFLSISLQARENMKDNKYSGTSTARRKRRMREMGVLL